MRKWPLFLASATLGSCFVLALSWTPQSQAQQSQNSARESSSQFPTDAPRRILAPWPEPRPPRPWPAPLTELVLERQQARVEIRGPLARTHLTQKLRNPTQRSLEGSYLWALPKGAAVSNFAMTMGGKRLEAEVLDGDQARQIYQGIVQKLRDPAILEYLDRDLIRAKIFPVPPGDSVEIEVDYAQTVAQGGYSLPLRAPGASGKGASASIEISLQVPDVRAVYSPSHSVETRREGNITRVSGEFSSSDGDFSLLWTRGGEKIGLDLLTTREAGEDGYFLLLAAPDPTLSAQQIEAKDVVFVFDTSGSMEGAKIEQARRALKTLLGNLGPRDRFNIVTFASAVQTFRDGLTPASKANLDAARTFAEEIRAVGGTNISDALSTALKMTSAGARPQQIVFMTDGQPTVGQTDPDAILRDVEAAKSAARLFVFGVGSDVNARLLDSLAENGRGASDYVLPNEDIEVKVGALYDKIAFPVLSDAKIDFGDLSVYDVYPPRLPDLFRGSQATVFGRFRGAGSSRIALTGQQGGQSLRFGGTVSGSSAPEMPKLWATRKVGWLLDDARRAGRPVAGEVRDEIIKLSRKYGIVTPLTAALITEDGAQPAAPNAFPGGSMPSSPMFRSRGGGGRGGGFGGGLPADEALSAPRRMADTGAAGVAASQATRALREGRSEAVQGSKTVAGKTFRLQNGVWTDSELAGKTGLPTRAVKFASIEYFGLMKEAKLAKWLSVGDRVALLWQGEILKVEP